MSVRYVSPEESDFAFDEEEFQEEVKQGLSIGYYTPDIARLQRLESQDVFIYGTMKKGFGNDEYINTNKEDSLGIGWTSSNNLQLYRHLKPKGGVEAVAMASQIPTTTACLYGEIYRIPTASIIHLDWLMSNCTMYKRVMQSIKVQRGKNYVIHNCWVYLGLRTHFNSKLGTDLLPAEKLTSNMFPHPYYNFQKKYVLNS